MPDPTRPGSLYGLQIHVVPDRPRYTMPEWLIPGVLRWPQALRDEVDQWAVGVCGATNPLKDGEAVAISNQVHVNPRTFNALRKLP